MGNRLSVHRKQFGLHNLSDAYSYLESIGNGRLFQSIKCRTESPHDSYSKGNVVVKIYHRELEGKLTEKRRKIEWESLREARDRLHQLSVQLMNEVGTCGNVLPYARLELCANEAYLIRQYMHANLIQRMSTRPYLSKMMKRWIVFQILCALDQMDRAGVHHGDIKPQNVLLTSWDWVVLSDFAIFKPVAIAANDTSDYSYYFDAEQSRTRCYLAPERILGEESAEFQPSSRVHMENDSFGDALSIEDPDLRGLLDEDRSDGRYFGISRRRPLFDAGPISFPQYQSFSLSHELEPISPLPSGGLQSVGTVPISHPLISSTFPALAARVGQNAESIALSDSSSSSSIDDGDADHSLSDDLSDFENSSQDEPLHSPLDRNAGVIHDDSTTLSDTSFSSPLSALSQQRSHAPVPTNQYHSDSRSSEPSFLNPSPVSASSSPLSTADSSHLTSAMDIFSAGCVIAELYTNGKPIFTLSRLLDYRSGRISLPSHVSKIRDIYVRDLVSSMLSLDPHDRRSAREYIDQWTPSLFPKYFRDMHQNLFSESASLSVSQRIDNLRKNFTSLVDMINSESSSCDETEPNGEVHRKDSSHSSGIDIIVRYLDCCAQTALIPSEKAITLSLLRKCTPLTSDLIRMQVIIPLAIRFLDAVLSPLLPAHPNLPPNSSNVNTLHSYARFFKPAQTNTIIGIESIGLLTDVLSSMQHYELQELHLFSSIIFPAIFTAASDHRPALRSMAAFCLPRIASAAFRFVECIQSQKISHRRGPHLKENERDPFLLENSEVHRNRITVTLSNLFVRLSSDTHSEVRRSLLVHLSDIAEVFGEIKTVEYLLLRILTYFNSRDRRVRSASLACLAHLSKFVLPRDMYNIILPCLFQSLKDPQEIVIRDCILSLSAVIEQKLLFPRKVLEVVGFGAPFLLHPNSLIRRAVYCLLEAASESIGNVQSAFLLVPLLRSYCRKTPSNLKRDSVSFSQLYPIPRDVFESALSFSSENHADSISSEEHADISLNTSQTSSLRERHLQLSVDHLYKIFGVPKSDRSLVSCWNAFLRFFDEEFLASDQESSDSVSSIEKKSEKKSSFPELFSLHSCPVQYVEEIRSSLSMVKPLVFACSRSRRNREMRDTEDFHSALDHPTSDLISGSSKLSSLEHNNSSAIVRIFHESVSPVSLPLPRGLFTGNVLVDSMARKIIHDMEKFNFFVGQGLDTDLIRKGGSENRLYMPTQGRHPPIWIPQGILHMQLREHQSGVLCVHHIGGSRGNFLTSGADGYIKAWAVRCDEDDCASLECTYTWRVGTPLSAVSEGKPGSSPISVKRDFQPSAVNEVCSLGEKYGFLIAGASDHAGVVLFDGLSGSFLGSSIRQSYPAVESAGYQSDLDSSSPGRIVSVSTISQFEPLIVSCSSRGEVNAFDVRCPWDQPALRFRSHPLCGMITSCSVGDFSICLASHIGVLSLWDVRFAIPSVAYQLNDSSYISSIRFHGAASVTLSAGEMQARRYNLETGKCTHTFLMSSHSSDLDVSTHPLSGTSVLGSWTPLIQGSSSLDESLPLRRVSGLSEFEWIRGLSHGVLDDLFPTRKDENSLFHSNTITFRSSENAFRRLLVLGQEDSRLGSSMGLEVDGMEESYENVPPCLLAGADGSVHLWNLRDPSCSRLISSPPLRKTVLSEQSSHLSKSNRKSTFLSRSHDPSSSSSSTNTSPLTAGRISESLSDLSSSPYFSISHPSLCPITVFDPLQYASQRSGVDPLLFAKPGTLRRDLSSNVGHFDSVLGLDVIPYRPNLYESFLVTGGQDGFVKLWT